uniref:Uncharacterized protein n=1 Tax=Oryza sativa subsp. japonica TaxID=39947 RepID=Q8LHP8_ORYSJ|nr:hypothetical protein [Oryza sativa Japonica Group]BAC65422.1 hypothetical protein [Oryza sativa Japonica Group]
MLSQRKARRGARGPRRWSSSSAATIDSSSAHCHSHRRSACPIAKVKGGVRMMLPLVRPHLPCPACCPDPRYP